MGCEVQFREGEESVGCFRNANVPARVERTVVRGTDIAAFVWPVIQGELGRQYLASYVA